MKPMRSLDVQELAAIGARVRIKELRGEIDMILDGFPGLRKENGNGNGAAVAPLVKPRRHMSKKARQAIGDAQRKRWAAQKAAQKEKGRSQRAAPAK